MILRSAFTAACLVAVLSSPGCVPWTTDLPPDLAARVNGQTGTIMPQGFVSAGGSTPETVEEGRKQLIARIEQVRSEKKAELEVEVAGINEIRNGPDGLPETEDDLTTEAARAIWDERNPDAAERDSVGRTLSVADLRLLVLQRNLDLEVVAFDPAIAAQRLGAEQAKFDATLFFGAQFQDQNLSNGKSTPFDISSPNPVLNGEQGFLTGSETERDLYEIEVGAKVPLPTGGEIKFGQVFLNDDKDTDFGASTEDRSRLKFSLTQNLLRNAGIDVNTASIRIADYGKRATEAKTKLTAIRILANAEKAYWKLWGAREVVRIREEQFELATDNVALIEFRIDRGVSAELERFSANLAVVKQLQKLREAEVGVRLDERKVRLSVNEADLTAPSADDSFLPVTEPQLLRFDLDPGDLVQQALRNRMDLLELELKLAADAVNIDFAENQTLPVFAFDFDYELSQRGATTTSAFGDAFDRDDQTIGVGFRAEIPATNRRALAKYAEALAVRGRRLAKRSARVLKIQGETLDALDRLNFGWNLVLLARQGVIAATANYDAEIQRLTTGASSSQDVLIALQLLGDARADEVKAVVSYQLAQIDLAFATGTLLGYSGTELGPLMVPGAR